MAGQSTAVNTRCAWIDQLLMLCKDASEELGDLPIPPKLYQRSIFLSLFQLTSHFPLEKMEARVSGIVRASLLADRFFFLELICDSFEV